MGIARSRVLAATVAVAVLAALTACSTADGSEAPSATRSRVLKVVAAENFWGSIASQLGGSHVEVTSIIDNPNADPHDYEPTPAAGRAVATADLVLVNGVGYDGWATKLVDANTYPRRTVVTVGDVVGAPNGANPHRWYDPADVHDVIDRITAAYQSLDPADARAFAALRTSFVTRGLAHYDAAISDIRTRYAGTPVGASESIFAMLAPALGLDLVTPPSFLRAISEGTDPTASDTSTIDAQIAQHRIAVYVYNKQNVTPDVQSQVDAATAAGIPVTTITETMTPAGTTFQQWQTAQLVALRAALAHATTDTSAASR